MRSRVDLISAYEWLYYSRKFCCFLTWILWRSLDEDVICVNDDDRGARGT